VAEMRRPRRSDATPRPAMALALVPRVVGDGARAGSCPGPGEFARFDRASSCWRACRPADSAAGLRRHRGCSGEYLARWPRHGLIRRGRSYELAGSRLGCREGGRGSWPTPNAKVSNLGERPPSWLARRQRLKRKRYNGNGAGMPLAIAVQIGPRWREADAAARPLAAGGRLNPTWVEWLMGFPLGWTALPGEADRRLARRG